MSFDPVAAVIDWLDAYRSSDLKTILEMYSSDAVIECRCCDMSITGAKGLRAYWMQRFRDAPALRLDDVRPTAAGASISYRTREGVVHADLEFDGNGRIALLRCGPPS
jgi:hypothetical protein